MTPPAPAAATRRPTRVAVLGGGIAGLTTAFELSRPVHDGAYEVTVYTQGWRLGGKGASGRAGSAMRIQEHGLHVWFGFYRNAFGMMRECLDAQTPPAVLDSAFKPIDVLTLVDEGRAYCLPLPRAKLDDPRLTELPRVILAWLRAIADAADVAVDDDAHPLGRATQARADVQAGLDDPEEGHWGHIADRLRDGWEDLAGAAAEVRFISRIAAFWGTVLVGLLADVLRHDHASWGSRIDALNGEELRDWLRRHGAADDVLDAPFVRALYDLVFAYRAGDQAAPEIAAGAGVENLLSILTRNHLTCMAKLRGGMGDVVFVPLYDVLKLRGVRFAFFHTVTSVVPSRDEPLISAIELTRQVELAAAAPAADGDRYQPPRYDPLIALDEVRAGLRCWPAEPLVEQLSDASRRALAALDRPVDLEREGDPVGGARLRLERGRDFDEVVLAIPVGAHAACCSELVRRDASFAAMAHGAGPVATQSLQLWLRRDRGATGWPGDAVHDGILGNARQPLATVSDMTHVLELERWTGPRPPRQLAYLCGVLHDDEAACRSWWEVDAAVRARVLDCGCCRR